MKKNTYPHVVVLSTLAGLTLLFLAAAAYSLWNEPEIVQESRIIKSSASQGRNLPSLIEFTVNRTGIVAISEADLAQINFRVDAFSANHINLLRLGEAVPFFIDPESSTLYFYNPPAESDFEATAVYRLALESGLPMTKRDAFPTERGNNTGTYQYKWEEHSQAPAQANGIDLWLGHLLLAPRTWQLPLDEIRSDGGPGELIIDFWSNTEDTPNPDHHVDVLLNNQPLASWYWDGIRHEQMSVAIPEEMLKPGEFNTLTISAPGDTGAVGESIYINKVTLNFDRDIELWREQLAFSSSSDNVQVRLVENKPLIFDITNPHQPVALTNFRLENEQVNFSGSGADSRYVVIEPWQAIQPTLGIVPQWKSSLVSESRGADYLAIVADEEGFMEALQSLIAHRRAQGLRVTAVSLSQIYDEFGSGEASPEAIRTFLSYAADSWQPPAPQYVLLVGDANYDLRNLTNGKNGNLIPTFIHTTQDAQYMASDTRLVQFADETTPQMVIGRFPVQTVEQLQTLIAKTVAYENGETAVWQQRALFVTEASEAYDALSQNLADKLINTNFAVHQLAVAFGDSAHYDIISAFSNGAGIINYSGYGREQYWGDASIFHARDADMLANSGRFPVLTTFTCNNGVFAHPQDDSLAESLLWVEDGGIVAAISASGRTEMAGQTALADAFYARLFMPDAPTLGMALTEAKTTVASRPDSDDTIHAFHLLGDPALTVKQP